MTPSLSLTPPAPTDYVGGSLYVSVPAGTVEVTLPVTTLFDNLAENNEHFKATLSLPDGPKDMVVGSLDVVFVTITDTKRMLKLILGMHGTTHNSAQILYNYTIPVQS